MRLRRRWPLLLATAVSASVALSWVSGVSLALNPTPSMPRGLYLLTPIGVPQRGDVVAACIPAIPAARLYLARGYVPADPRCVSGVAPELKPIVAAPGDTVEVGAAGVSVNGQLLPNSRLVDTDSQGRPIAHLPLGWRRTLPSDEYFLLANRIARSLDSRVYGPLRRDGIFGRIRPILTD